MKKLFITIVYLYINIFFVCAQKTNASMSERDFFNYTKNLFEDGNDKYANWGNKTQLKYIIDTYQNAINERFELGLLPEEKRDSLLEEELNKLWGDYHYLNADEDSGSYRKAEEYFNKCMEYAQTHSRHQNAHHNEFILMQELAQLYYKQKLFNRAKEKMEDAYWTASKYIDNDTDSLLDIQAQYAICLARVNEYSKASEYIEGVLLYYNNKDTERYGEALRKKAKILMIKEEQGETIDGSEALKCYKEYFNIKKKDALAHFLSMTSEEREQYWMRIRPFVTDCYRLEDKDAGFLYDVTLFAKGLLLQLDSAGGGRQNINATWQMIQDKLKPDACAIEFIQYEKYGQQQMGALVLKKTGKPEFVKMATPESVMRHKINVKGSSYDVDSLIRFVHINSWIDDSPYKNNLYLDSIGLNCLIWNPHLIKTIGKSKDVWFAPDGYSHLLAIEYLLPYGMEGIKCHRLSSTRCLLEKRSHISNLQALIVGGINYHSTNSTIHTGNDGIAYNYIKQINASYKELDNSLNEVQKIIEIRNNPQDIMFIADNASEQNFRLYCAQFPLVHFSTHGTFGAATIPQGTDLKPCATDRSLSESILALAGIQYNLNNNLFNQDYLDGILSAKEFASFDMSHTELAILCCCETGLGYVTSDGIYGIQRGLKNAGVKAIICTLWDINDEASCFFMVNFHQYLTEGSSIQDAFYKARSDMKDYSEEESTSTLAVTAAKMAHGNNFSEPCYRDAFILIDALE